MNKGDIILIEWVDPTTYSGHQDAPESLIGSLAKTTGFFVNEDEQYIRLAHTHYGGDGVADVTVVVKSLLIVEPLVLLTVDELNKTASLS